MPIPREALKGFVATATLAPSSHNTQPWSFVVGDGSVEIWADRTRRLPVNDPDDRELVMSCGAALFTLRVAVAAAGLASSVICLPDGDEPGLLAVVDVAPGEVDEDLAALLPHVARRHTHRDAFADPDGAELDVPALVDATEHEGAGLVVLDDGARAALDDLVEEGDRIQFASAPWRHELASWMHPRRQGDGLTTAPVAGPISRAVVSTFDLGRSMATKDRNLADDAEVLVALTTPADGTLDRLRAGQALQRLLLTAEGQGRQAGFLNQPCQVEALRPRLRTLVGTGQDPQVVLRLGRPRRPGRPAPRRPLAEVLRAPAVSAAVSRDD